MFYKLSAKFFNTLKNKTYVLLVRLPSDVRFSLGLWDCST